MRLIALVVAAAVVTTGCASQTYKIPAYELQRLSQQPPDTRAERVRVQQELGDADVGPPQPVTAETQVVFFPHIHVGGAYERRRYYQSGSSWGTGGGGGGPSGRGGASSLKLNGGGDGKGAAIVILVVAAVALVAVAAVEGSRFDGYAQLHPMHPVYLVGRDGGRVVLPLAWIDPMTAQWAKYGLVRRHEGPFTQLERAPLDREGWNYSMYGGIGTFESADGSKAAGTATTIQLGYFPSHPIGIVGSIFFGWRQNAVDQTLFESRYTLELQGYPIHTGPFQVGGYIGGGAAYRFEDGIDGGNSGSSALIGGGMLQLDVNTRIAITARLGVTRAHQERMTDAMVGLSVY
ncbi:MAG TPA: hypothetical protein VIV11_43400 [Kofleriaceae bacterium]